MSWPPGLYPERVTPLSIDNDLLDLEGRHRHLVGGNKFGYGIWCHRE
jgi:hypothetical protein